MDGFISVIATQLGKIKKDGYVITGEMEPVKNRHGETCYVKRYRLAENCGGDQAQ